MSYELCGVHLLRLSSRRRYRDDVIATTLSRRRYRGDDITATLPLQALRHRRWWFLCAAGHVLIELHLRTKHGRLLRDACRDRWGRSTSEAGRS